MFTVTHYVGSAQPEIYTATSAPVWVTSGAISFQIENGSTVTVAGSFSIVPF